MLNLLGAQPAPSVPAVPDSDVVGYVARWGGQCRDCADEHGVCPNSGLPCGGSSKAIEHVIAALQYGVQNGYISNPLAAAPHPAAKGGAE